MTFIPKLDPDSELIVDFSRPSPEQNLKVRREKAMEYFATHTERLSTVIFSMQLRDSLLTLNFEDQK